MCKEQQHRTINNQALRKLCACSSLFLCYPDDLEDGKGSLAHRCLQRFGGNTIVHVGELFGDTVLADAAPWGRTTAQSFQEEPVYIVQVISVTYEDCI